MTTGNRTYDARYDAGVGRTAGLYTNRVWNGSNSPPLQRNWNSYSATITQTYSERVQWKQKASSNWVSGDIIGLYGDPTASSPIPGWTSNDENRVLSNLVSQVKGHDFNAAVFLGEGRETLGMIASTATRIAKAGLAVKKFDLISAARALGVVWKGSAKKKTVSANWLELQYGWLPLLGDISNAAEALVALTNKPLVNQYRVRGYTRFKGYWTQTNGSALWLLDNYYRRTYILRMTEQYSKIASLGLLDPELVAWELVPFSFVADWFMPIGTYLENRAAIGRIQGSWLRTDTSYKDAQWAANRSSTIDVIGGQSTRSKKIIVTRTTIAAPVVPLPSVKSFDKIASWQHCANALALVRQVFL